MCGSRHECFWRHPASSLICMLASNTCPDSLFFDPSELHFMSRTCCHAEMAILHCEQVPAGKTLQAALLPRYECASLLRALKMLFL